MQLHMYQEVKISIKLNHFKEESYILGQSKYKPIINIKEFCVKHTNFGCKIGCEIFGCLMSDLETSRSNLKRSSPKQIATSEFQNSYFPYNVSTQIPLVLCSKFFSFLSNTFISNNRSKSAKNKQKLRKNLRLNFR